MACGTALPAVAAPTAEAVIDRSRTTQATYVLYLWNIVRPEGGGVFEDWGAEFHSRNLHRVETPYFRVVADCSAMTGISLNLVTGETQQGASVANAACGIDSNAPVVSSRLTGRANTRFGPADGVEIVDPHQFRTYQVSDEGILIAATIASKDQPEALIVDNWATHLSHALPEGDIFSQESLNESFVGDEYRRRKER